MSPACISLGFSRCSFLGKKMGTSAREDLQGTVRGAPSGQAEGGQAEGGQELERSQSQA